MATYTRHIKNASAALTELKQGSTCIYTEFYQQPFMHNFILTMLPATNYRLRST